MQNYTRISSFPRFVISHHELSTKKRHPNQLQLKHQNLIEVLQNQDVSVHVDALHPQSQP